MVFSNFKAQQPALFRFKFDWFQPGYSRDSRTVNLFFLSSPFLSTFVTNLEWFVNFNVLDDESDYCNIQKVVYYILYVTYCMWQSIIWHKGGYDTSFWNIKLFILLKHIVLSSKSKNHKSSHFSCFKRSIFSFLIIIISSASIEIKWSKVHWSVHWSFYPKFPRLKFRISFTHEWDFEPDRRDSFGQKGQGVY